MTAGDEVLPAWEPSDAVAAVLRDALAAAEEGEWEAAGDQLLAGLELHPGDPWLLCWLGLTERELGLEGSASERFRAALSADPRDPVLLATAGNALASLDDPAAEGALRSAALLAPDLPQARWMYGAYLSREGMIAEALGELGAAMELDPDDPVIRVELGVAHALAGAWDEAEAALAGAVELDPEDGWALILLGLVRVEHGELEDAARVLEEGARLRPEDVEAQLLAALALAATGRDDRALEMVERARMHAEGGEAGVLDEAEERLEDGIEVAASFLRDALAPSSLRERLLVRP